MEKEKEHIARLLIDELADVMGIRKYREKQKEGEKTNHLFKSEWLAGILFANGGIDTIERCYEFINENKPELALVQIVEDMNVFTKSVNTFKLNSFRQQSPIQLKLYDILKRIVAEYDRWEKEEYTPMINAYKGTHIFRNEEFAVKDNFSPSLFCYVEEAMKKNLFKSYIYKQGSGRITQQTQHYIYPKIGISYSLEEWLQFIEKQDMSAAENKAVVTMFYKQDYASEHYNYFIITIHHKDSIWLSTDQLFFYNPLNKTSSRKPERHKNDHYDYINLPYDLCDEIQALREKNKSLVRMNDEAIKRISINLDDYDELLGELDKKRKDEDDERGMDRTSCSQDYKYEAIIEHLLKKENILYSVKNHTYDGTEYKLDGSIKALWQPGRYNENHILFIYRYPEILQKDFIDLHTMQKMYFLGLVTRIFEEIGYAPPKEVVTTGQRYLSQMMLSSPDKAFVYDDNIATERKKGQKYEQNYEQNKFKFSGFSSFIKMQFDEMIESFGLKDSESQAILISEYKQVANSASYEKDWLGVPAALDSNIKWSILNDKKLKLIEEIEKLITKDRIKQDSKLLADMISANIDTAYHLAFNDVEFCENMFTGFRYEPIDDDPSSDGYGFKEAGKHWISLTEKSIKSGNSHAKSSSLYLDDYFNIFLPKADKNLSRWERKEFEPKCQLCTDNIKLKESRISFNIKHHKQLMMMLGTTDRMMLPLSYRNYRSGQYIPYKGNDILDNTHPYALIDDPMSRLHPNGFNIYVWMCGNCFIKLKNKHTT